MTGASRKDSHRVVRSKYPGRLHKVREPLRVPRSSGTRVSGAGRHGNYSSGVVVSHESVLDGREISQYASSGLDHRVSLPSAVTADDN